jgi:hypothetical protein
LQFLSLLLAALGLAPRAAHLLEMPVKLGYTPEQYFEVYADLRMRWECGHVVAFVLWLAGYLCLSWLVVRRPRVESSKGTVNAFA